MSLNKPSIKNKSALGQNQVKCTFCGTPITNRYIEVDRSLLTSPELLCIPCAADIGKASGNVE